MKLIAATFLFFILSATAVQRKSVLSHLIPKANRFHATAGSS